MDDKIIVSNRGVLRQKYGAKGLQAVEAAVRKLMAADARRGIKTDMVYLDVAAAMKPFGGKAVSSAANFKENKAAIDAIFGRASPDYLMILGARDVIPHQDLRNPLKDPTDDPDSEAWGDLPYCCDSAYSKDIAAFKGPTRVVGRLPDLVAAEEPSYLLSLLNTAAGYSSQAPEAYGGYFGLTAKTWKKSTQLSLFNIFGSSTALNVSPKAGPAFTAPALAPLAHFINCHGGSSNPNFYGEDSRSQPISMTSQKLASKIQRGTVAAAECCYGAQLYQCVAPLNLPLPICQEYLRQGAYGFFGSTTIAYGPADTNGQADLITQYFMLAVLEGASLGRAALTARQRFLEQTSELDPADLKTLAQFLLLGDPSIHPIMVKSTTEVPKALMKMDEGSRLQRRDRRAKLRARGDLLKRTKPTASVRSRRQSQSAAVHKVLSDIAREAGIGQVQPFSAFDVKAPAAARMAGRKDGGGPSVATRYYVAGSGLADRSKERPGKVVVAREVEGRIVGYRIYVAR